MDHSLTLSQVFIGFIHYKTAAGLSEHTIADYHVTRKKVQLYFPDDPIFTSITRAQWVDFFAWLQSEYISQPNTLIPRRPKPLSAKSVFNIHTNLGSLYAWCVKEEIADRNLIHTIDRPRYEDPVIEPFSRDEMAALLKACDRTRSWSDRATIHSSRYTAVRDRCIIRLLLDTGVRAEELCTITYADLNLGNNSITIRGKGKGRDQKERTVHFGKMCAQSIWKYLMPRLDRIRPDDPLFLKRAVIDGSPMNRASLYQLIRDIGERAGVQNCHPHRFRHTFAITYLRNGGDVFTLQMLLGHSYNRSAARLVSGNELWQGSYLPYCRSCHLRRRSNLASGERASRRGNFLSRHFIQYETSGCDALCNCQRRLDLQSCFFSTHDGGQTWTDEKRNIVALEIVGQSVWAVEQRNDQSVIIASNDLGQTWKVISSLPMRSSGVTLVRANVQTAWILARQVMTREAQLIVTEDEGNNWHAQSLPLYAGHCTSLSLARSSDKKLWLLCGDGLATAMQPKWLYTSVDNGATWDLVANNDPTGTSKPQGHIPIVGHMLDSRGFAVTSPTTAFMALNRGTLYVTHNGGQDWEEVVTDQPINLGDAAIGPLRFIDGIRGWLVAAGRIFRTANGGMTWQIFPIQ